MRGARLPAPPSPTSADLDVSLLMTGLHLLWDWFILGCICYRGWQVVAEMITYRLPA